MKTCMITGANSLLGLACVDALKKDFSVIQIAHDTEVSTQVRGTGRRVEEKIFRVDLSDPAECRTLIATHKPEVVVHAAEHGDIDFCESKSSSKWLNVESAKMLAGALLPECPFVFISSNHVFGGDASPYREADERNPINAYGKQKAAAEALVEQRENSLIIRVPQLIGREPEDQPGLLSFMLNAIEQGAEGELDNICQLYPTYSADVAEAVRFLLEQQAYGIFHAAHPDGGTVYSLTHRMANFTNLSLSHKRPSTEVIKPRHGAKRPVNNQLLAQKILELGFPGFRSFADTMGLLTDQDLLPGALVEHGLA